MLTIDPKKVSVQKIHGYLLGAVAPRPIAFASTMDLDGNINLSPFSFFNAFSANPPILIFSPSRRVRDNTTKHTLDNVNTNPEVVINIVNYAIAEQMSLSSTEYEKGVNEFEKAGLTMVASEKVKPPRVGESPVAFECRVNEVVPLGKEGGAGNLVICEVLLAHIKKEILDENLRIDPCKLDAIGRMGGNWYTRAGETSLFEISKPLATKGIGVDNIPDGIKNSIVLTGNDLGKLGNVVQLPEKEAIQHHTNDSSMKELRERFKNDRESYVFHLHVYAKELLAGGKIEDAWLTLLQAE